MQRKYKNLIWAVCKHLLGRQNYERFRFYYNLRYFPDLKNPKSFTILDNTLLTRFVSYFISSISS